MNPIIDFKTVSEQPAGFQPSVHRVGFGAVVRGFGGVEERDGGKDVDGLDVCYGGFVIRFV
jgi:hypothetical protein